jgi:hypothetical protein
VGEVRIRTVKPAFWSSEDLSIISESALLLAIGILNYSDDDGYFIVNPALIKAALFPLRNTPHINALLFELQGGDYLEFRKIDRGRILGRVKNFKLHQVINRPQVSQLKDLWEKGEAYELPKFTECSVNDHGAVTDHSHGNGRKEGREGNGMEVLAITNVIAHPSSPPDCPEVEEPKAKKSAFEKLDEATKTKGLKFAAWFRATLSPDVRLSEGWEKAWAVTYDELIRIDKRPSKELRAVCEFGRNDSFWSENFLSPAKLRKRKDGILCYDTLKLRMENAQKKKEGAPATKADWSESW